MEPSSDQMLLGRVRAAARLATWLGDANTVEQLAARACSLGRSLLGADACALFLDDPPRRIADAGFALLPPDHLLGSLEAAELDRFGDWARAAGFRRVELAPFDLDHQRAGLLALLTVAAGPELGDEDLHTLGAGVASALSALRSSSELQRACAKADREQDQVVRAERIRALGAMALGIAHDFNNVLNGILAQVGVLAHLARGQEPLEAALERLRKGAVEGAATVERVQEFSRQRRDQEFEPVALDELVAERVAQLRARPPGGVELRVSSVSGALVSGNGAELRQVIDALVTNALESMRDRGTLTIELSHDGDGVLLVIGDTGHGMSRDVRRRAFDPFFTTKGSRTKGLGLSFAYGAVRRHGGRIDLESEPGRGARVRLRLPGLAPLTVGTRPAPAPLKRPASSPVRVLLVEDDPDNREAMASLLELSGYRVTAAESGQLGVSAFTDGAFDLVLTDLGLPDMNGWLVAGAIKSASPSTPVALITGWGFNLDGDEIRRRGVDLLVKKPIDPRRFLTALETLLSGAPAAT